MAVRSGGRPNLRVGAKAPQRGASFPSQSVVHSGGKVPRTWKILIADRNRHVRDLLRRELTAEGYEVTEAWDGHEVWQRLTGPDPPDMLILDPNLPYLEELVEMVHFRESPLAVPLILYMFQEEEADLPLPPVAKLEKQEDPSTLKEMVARILKHRQGGSGQG